MIITNFRYDKIIFPNKEIGIVLDNGNLPFCQEAILKWKYENNEELILENTKKALEDMVGYLSIGDKFISPKFNSGLYNVPWEKTEAILKEFVDKHNIEWIVYNL